MKINIYYKYLLLTLIALIQYPDLNSQVLFKIPSKDTVIKISPIKELQNDIEAIINDNDFNDAFIGASIIAPEHNEVLYQKNENKNFIPASNQKIVTTATALRYLGADYKFQTKMYLEGEVNSDGEYIGDIYLRGFGDPSISEYFYDAPFQIFDYFRKKLDSLGIKSIQGDLIGDDNFFDDAYYSPGWQIDDINYSYSAQVNALSIMDNKVDIIVNSGASVGSYAIINVLPKSDYINITNNVRTSSSLVALNIYAVREPCTNNITVFGNIPYDSVKTNEYKISVAIENPTMYFLYLFRDYLENNNIDHKGGLWDIDEIQFLPDYSDMEKSFTFYSPKLSEIIKVVNRESHNLGAEMLLKTLGRETAGFGSTAKGLDQVEKYLGRIGVNTKRLFIYDGSGLSRMNMITPNVLTSILNNMYKSEHKNVFFTSLAASNESGTMKRRLSKTAAEKRVRAKTGTMNNVSTISGYVKSRDDETLIFSILINNFTVPLSKAQTLQDLIIMRLSAFTRYPERFNDKK